MTRTKINTMIDWKKSLKRTNKINLTTYINGNVQKKHKKNADLA